MSAMARGQWVEDIKNSFTFIAEGAENAEVLRKTVIIDCYAVGETIEKTLRFCALCSEYIFLSRTSFQALCFRDIGASMQIMKTVEEVSQRPMADLLCLGNRFSLAFEQQACTLLQVGDECYVFDFTHRCVLG